MLSEIGKTFGWIVIVGLIMVLVFFLAVQSVVLFQFLPSTSSIAAFRGEKLAVLSVNGPIFSVQEKLDRLRSYRKDDSVKGLLVEVNSPGGAVAPSQELAKAVKRFAGTGRPVVTSIRGVGASGAYYVASSSDTIVANPGSLVGSIGVVVQFMKFQELMDKIGVDYKVVKSGRFKDLGSPFSEMPPKGRKILRSVIMSSYDQFINHILENRPQLGRKKLEAIADGRIMTGQQSLRKRLIDRLGSRHEAVEVLRDAAGVSDSVPVWEPSTGQFGFRDVKQALLSPLTRFIGTWPSGFRLLYIMPDWTQSNG